MSQSEEPPDDAKVDHTVGETERIDVAAQYVPITEAEGKRTRKLTEKGLAYQIDLKQKDFDKEERKLREVISELHTLTITSSHINTLQENIEAVLRQLDTLNESYNRLAVYVSGTDKDNLTYLVDCSARAVSEVKKTAKERIQELRFKEYETMSQTSYKSRRSSRSSRSKASSSMSLRQRKLKLAEDEAALKVELDFEEEESKLVAFNVENERKKKQLSLQRELAKKRAQIEVCLKVEREDLGGSYIGSVIDSLPPRDKRSDMERFLDSDLPISMLNPHDSVQHDVNPNANVHTYINDDVNPNASVHRPTHINDDVNPNANVIDSTRVHIDDLSNVRSFDYANSHANVGHVNGYADNVVYDNAHVKSNVHAYSNVCVPPIYTHLNTGNAHTNVVQSNYSNPQTYFRNQPTYVPVASNYANVGLHTNVPISHVTSTSINYSSADLLAQSNKDTTIAIKQLVDSFRLPPVKVEAFNGDPIKFPMWESSFNALIEAKAASFNEKLNLLSQHLTGEPRDMVSNYLLLQSEEAYAQAKCELKERYGCDSVISKAFTNKIAAWPKIASRDCLGLRKYSDFVNEVLAAQKRVPDLKVLDFAQENAKLVSKLPYHIEGRWRKIVQTYLDDRSFPPLNKFAEFLKARAREANIAIFEQPIRNDDAKPWFQQAKKSPFSNKPKTSSLATNSSVNITSNIKCPFCKSSHHIDECVDFMKLTRKDRKQFLINENLCFSCGMSREHRRYDCNARVTCKKCSRVHLTCMHFDKQQKSVSRCTSVCEEVDTCMDNSMIVPVWVRSTDNPTKEVLQYCILDPQSNTCFMSTKLQHKLDITGQKTNLSLSTMHKTGVNITSNRIRNLEILSYDRNTIIPLPNVYTRDSVPAERSQIPRPDVARKWNHLKPIADEIVPYMPDVDVGLLIGNNVPSAIRPRDIVADGEDHPYGQKSILGWGVVGMMCRNVSNAQVQSVSNRISVLQPLQPNQNPHKPSNTIHHTDRLVFPNTTKEIVCPQQINQMFELDFIEHRSKCESISVEDRRFVKILEENIVQRDDGHYEMPLPLRSPDVELPNNRQVALKRLLQLKKRFARDAKYKDDYLIFMKDLLLNCAEKVPTDKLLSNNGLINYVPHTGVYHPKKPTQIRVVFDCSAEYDGVSLNDYLLQGPDLMNGLIGVLCRFRKENIAIMADIKGMFHQFYVREQDRDMLRFLWWKDSDPEKTIEEYRMTVHLFGATSSPGCANFGLKKAADDGEREFGKVAADFIREDFYVDDGLKSLPTVHEAVELVNSSKAICAKAGLKLHKWTSNSREVLQEIPEEDRAKPLNNLNIKIDPLPIERALGVTWCVELDCFQFRIEMRDRPLSRRGVLATVSSIYDPFGFVAPVVMEGKSILQAICKENADWDDPLPEQLRPKWEKWRHEIHQLEQLQIQRCFKPNNFGEPQHVEIHYFSDASEHGYGQCTYLRLINKDDKCACSFIVGKARVTPAKKNITIPRLELTAAVTSARMSSFLKQELRYDEFNEFFWTDSEVVLGYIGNESKRFQVYVANRVQQIHDRTEPRDWRYIESASNPSDDASRGLTAKQLLSKSSRWLNGPGFLHQNGRFVTQRHDIPLPFNEDAEKEINQNVKRTAIGLHTVTQNQTPHYLTKYFERCSSWFLVKRAVANCLNLKKRMMELAGVSMTKNGTIDHMSGTFTSNQHGMTVQDLKESEMVIIKHIQDVNFHDEIKSLQEFTTNDATGREKVRMKKCMLKRKCSIYRLDPFLDDDDVLRVGGRIRRANIPRDVKHPCIIPRKSRITTLIVQHYHQRVNHMGRTTTHNHIRQNGYWIVGASSAVSQCIYKCVVCKKLRCPPLTQKMADLPIDRIEQQPPFTYCGVDLFGPFLIKERRSKLKRYGVLFTCLASRGIHLETVNSLETDSFLNALRRFLSIRGPSRQIRSDQGTNLVGADNEMKKLKDEIDEQKVKSYLLKENCDWVGFKFNVPSASHMGGIWERQIRTVRNALEPLLHQNGDQIDDESLRTFFAEVQNIVNSRPLTTDALSEAQAPEPLTPNHLLTMKSHVLLPPPGNFQKGDLYCRKRWRRVQYLTNEFWHRWKKEYLLTLQPRKKWSETRRNLKVGDVVIVKDDNLPRNSWQLAAVTKVYPSEDNLVRKVQIAIASKQLDEAGKRQNKLTTLDRPIHKLVLLVPIDE